MENTFNQKLAEQAKKRRLKFYIEYKSGKSCIDLAKKHKMSRQRMQVLLDRAANDIEAGS